MSLCVPRCEIRIRKRERSARFRKIVSNSLEMATKFVKLLKRLRICWVVFTISGNYPFAIQPDTRVRRGGMFGKVIQVDLNDLVCPTTAHYYIHADVRMRGPLNR